MVNGDGETIRLSDISTGQCNLCRNGALTSVNSPHLFMQLVPIWWGTLHPWAAFPRQITLVQPGNVAAVPLLSDQP